MKIDTPAWIFAVLLLGGTFVGGCSTPCSCQLPKTAAAASSALPSPEPSTLTPEARKIKTQIDFLDSQIGNDESEIESIQATDEPPYNSRITYLQQDIKRLQKQKQDLLNQMQGP